MSLITLDPGEVGPTSRSQAMLQGLPRRGRYRLLSPGHIHVVSSTRLFGFLFGGVGVVLAAGTALAAQGHPQLVGVVALGLMSLTFLAVGWLPAWDRIELEIQPDSIEFERRIRFGRTRGHLAREALLRIRSDRVVRRGDKGSYVRYPVSLVFDANHLLEGIPGSLAIREFAREAEARREAETLARELDLPLEDAIGQAPTLRAPDALDAHLVQENDPGVPPSGQGLLVGAGAAEIEITSGTASGRVLLGAAAAVSGTSLLVGLVFGSRFWDGGSLPWVFVAPVVAIELSFVTLLLSIAWLQRWRLAVSAGKLSLSRRLGPVLVSRQSVPIQQIEGVRIDEGGPLGSGIAIQSDAQVLHICHLNPEAAGWLRHWIAAHAGG